MPITIKRKAEPPKKTRASPKRLIKPKPLNTSAPPKDWVPPGKKSSGRFSKIVKGVGPERMAMVDSMLISGEATEAVAKTIKLEWLLLPDITIVSLAARLSDYRKQVLVGKLQDLVTPGTTRVSDFAKTIDVMENLTNLISQQQLRVSRAIEAENGLPSLRPINPGTKLEIQLLANLYKQLGDIQMDLGILRKVPAKFQLESMSTATQQLLDNAMAKNTRVGAALSEAFKVLDGKFKVVADAPSSQH